MKVCSKCVILLSGNNIDHAAGILYKNKTFCTASLAVKNLRPSLDVQKQSFLFSGDLRWSARDKGELSCKMAL